MMKRTKISHRKFLLEVRNYVRKKIGRGCCENNAIYIKKKIGNLIVRVVNKKGIIRTRGRKTDGLNEVRKTLKPGAGSLF
jgi:hypothetical protein